MKRSQATGALTKAIAAARALALAEIMADPSAKFGWDETVNRLQRLRSVIEGLTEKEMAKLMEAKEGPERKSNLLF